MTTSSSAPASSSARPGLPWLLIVGLASLSLLWPLTTLIGLDSGAPRALTIIAVIAATWIGVVGFGRVPRPVLVLTLTGLGYGLITFAVSGVFGSVDGPIWTALVALVIDTFWGAMAGLMALVIQQIRKPSA